MVGRRDTLAVALVHGESPETELLRLVSASSVRHTQGRGVYPIHLAARYTQSETVMRAVLDACPDLLEAKTDLVRARAAHTALSPSPRAVSHALL